MSTQRKFDCGGGLATEYIREEDEFPATRDSLEPEVETEVEPEVELGVFDLMPRRSFTDPDRLVDGEGERRREEEGIGERER